MLGLVAIVSFATAQEAKGYIDPGSGAVIWQVIVATIVGGLFYIRKLNPIRWFRALKKKEAETISR